MKKNNHEKFLQLVGFLGIVLFLLFILLLLIHRNALSQFENFGYIGLFFINVISNATIFIPLPSIITVFVAGALWNPILVGLISGFGNGVGELVGFFMGFSGRRIIETLSPGQKKWLKRVEQWFCKSGFITIFIASALPTPFFDLVGILSGSLKYPIWKFFVATALGRIFRNLIIAWSGARILP